MVIVIGYVGDWWLSRASNGEELFIPLAALVPETDAITRIYIGAYYYPYRARNPCALGNCPSYSLSTGRETYIGLRGEQYYINGNRYKTYLKH